MSSSSSSSSILNLRVDLAVPFTERKEAHAEGAKWDAENKVWFIPSEFTGDRSVFKRWEKPIVYTASALKGAEARRFFQPKSRTEGNLQWKIENLEERIGDMEAKLSKAEDMLGCRETIINFLLDYVSHHHEYKAISEKLHATTGLCITCRIPYMECVCSEDEDSEEEKEPASKKAKTGK